MKFIVRRRPSGEPAVVHAQVPFGDMMAFAKVRSGLTELAAVPLLRAEVRSS
jgi:hypothetical protein